jgi:hypothetical protein
MRVGSGATPNARQSDICGFLALWLGESARLNRGLEPCGIENPVRNAKNRGKLTGRSHGRCVRISYDVRRRLLAEGCVTRRQGDCPDVQSRIVAGVSLQFR